MELLQIILTIGLPQVDENLIKILNAMGEAPNFIGSFTGIARIVGCCIALGIGSYEAWMMMLGRRGMDVMKILHIIIISICITSTGFITGTIDSMAGSLESQAKGVSMGKASVLADQEKNLAKLQDQYLTKLRAVQDSVRAAESALNHANADGWIEEVGAYITDLQNWTRDNIQRALICAEQKVCEFINDCIRFIGGLIFQMTFYGIMCAQKIFLGLLASVAPLMFALSLAPPWKSAWSQWMSKYISISLWGFVAFTVLVYVEHIMGYFIEQDTKVYEKLISGSESMGVGAIGLMAIGTNCMYVVALLIGAFIMRMVPEAASWMIPGGVSSGVGSATGGVAAGAMMSTVTHTQNSVTQMGTVGAAVAHPGTAVGKGVSAVAGGIARHAAPKK